MGGGPYYAVLGGSRILDSSMVDQSGSDDNPVTGWDKANEFIVAVCIHSGGKDTEAAAYKLQWQDDNDGGGYADLAATGELNYSCSITNLDHGDPVATGDQVCDIQGGDTRMAGEEVENASPSDSIDLPDDYQSELWFGINCEGADDEHTYSFHLYDVTNGRDLGLLGVTITMKAGAQTFYQNVGQGSMAIAGGVIKKTSKGMGGFSMTIVGALEKKAGKMTGGYSMPIAGALGKKTSKFPGGYSMPIVGALSKKMFQEAGGYAMTMAGELEKAILIQQTVGEGSVPSSGTLGAIPTFVRAVGQYSMGIVGILVKKTSIFIGGGSVPSAGSLSKGQFKDVGGGSVDMAGDVETHILMSQDTGGGLMSIVGDVARQFIPGTGEVYKFLKKILSNILHDILGDQDG